MITAEIISIGDELLIGQVVNTNASYIATQLNLIGIKVAEILTVQDDALAIRNAINTAIGEHQVVITTGGLGPTKDDITKQTLAEIFNSKLILNESVLKNNKIFFDSRNLEFTEINRKQAEVPDNCEVIENTCGTAAGMLFNTQNGLLVSMPGVPHEMKNMMSMEVIPRLKEKYQSQVIIHKTIMTCGLGESFLSDRIAYWEDALPTNMKLAYLPQPGVLRLRLTAIGENKKILNQEVNYQVEKLSVIIPELIYSYQDESIEEVVLKILKEKKITLSTAESCTGGDISRRITSISGSSDVFKGAIIAYSNDTKKNILNVSNQTLETYGAVSEECVKEMSVGVKKLLNTDCSIAVSGIAGPTGGTDDKPVGTVWISVSTPYNTISEKFSFGDTRERNVSRASIAALNLLRKNI